DEEERDLSRDDSPGKNLRDDARRAYENDDHEGRAHGPVDGHAAEEHEGGDDDEPAADPEEAGEDAGDNTDYDQEDGAAGAHYEDASRVALARRAGGHAVFSLHDPHLVLDRPRLLPEPDGDDRH